MLLFVVAYACSLVLFLVFLCLVPGDGPSEVHTHRINPGRSGSKRYRTSEAAAASSSVPSSSAPPTQSQPPTKSVAKKSKPKPKSVTEMTAKEFWEKRRRDPYEQDQEPNLVNRPFWNRFQWAIHFDVLKAKKNLYVDVRSISIAYMETDPEYFGEAL